MERDVIESVHRSTSARGKPLRNLFHRKFGRCYILEFLFNRHSLPTFAGVKFRLGQGVSKRRERSGAVLMNPAFCESVTKARTEALGISLVKMMRFHARAISSLDISARVSA